MLPVTPRACRSSGRRPGQSGGIFKALFCFSKQNKALPARYNRLCHGQDARRSIVSSMTIVLCSGMICSPALTRNPLRLAVRPLQDRRRSKFQRTPVFRSVHPASVPINLVSAPRHKRTSLTCSASADSMALQGRVAVVTGASRGIGRTIAQKLAGEGAHLALAARSADSLKQASSLPSCACSFETLSLFTNTPKLKSYVICLVSWLSTQISHFVSTLCLAAHGGSQPVV